MCVCVVCERVRVCVVFNLLAPAFLHEHAQSIYRHINCATFRQHIDIARWVFEWATDWVSEWVNECGVVTSRWPIGRATDGVSYFYLTHHRAIIRPTARTHDNRSSVCSCAPCRLRDAGGGPTKWPSTWKCAVMETVERERALRTTTLVHITRTEIAHPQAGLNDYVGVGDSSCA